MIGIIKPHYTRNGSLSRRSGQILRRYFEQNERRIRVVRTKFFYVIETKFDVISELEHIDGDSYWYNYDMPFAQFIDMSNKNFERVVKFVTEREMRTTQSKYRTQAKYKTIEKATKLVFGIT